MPEQISFRCKSNIRRYLSHSLLVFSSLSLLLLTASCEAKEPSDVIMFSRTKMLNLVNKARQSGQYCGKTWHAPAKKLKWNEQLEVAAKQHSLDMNDNKFFSHKGSDGKFVDERLYRQHYFWKACGENVAYGTLYEDEVMKEWLNSPGHCENIMNPAYSEIGAWLTGIYWTQVFATPQSQ